MKHEYYIGSKADDPNWKENALRLFRKIAAAFKTRTGRNDLVVGNYLESFEQKRGIPTGRICPVDVWLRHKSFEESLARELIEAVTEVYSSLGVQVIHEGAQIFTVCGSEKFLLGWKTHGGYSYGMKTLPGRITLFAWYEDELVEIDQSVRQ